MSFKDMPSKQPESIKGQEEKDKAVDLTRILKYMQESKGKVNNVDTQEQGNKYGSDYQSHPPSKVWGINHRQDTKSKPAEITGKYNPQQEHWSTRDDGTDRTFERTITDNGRDTIVDFD